MMNLVEAVKKYTGKIGYIETDGLKINVQVVAVKTSYGNVRYLVAPLSGDGEVWKEQVIFPPDDTD